MGKKLRDEDLRLNIIVNGDNGRKQIGELERAIHDANAKLETFRATQKKMEASGETQTQAYRKLTAQIVRTNKEIDDNRNKLAALRRQQNINTMTISELRKHQSMLNIQLARTEPGTQKWMALNAELKQTNARLAELRAQSKATSGVVGTLANKINRYIGLITAGFASFAFLVSGINRARNAFLEYDEACIDAMKTTGLTREEIEDLSSKLKQVDTRTAQNGLLDLVRVGGKLGITGKQDLLEFAKAADVINVALGRDLGDDTEDAIREIGKLVDIFHLRDNYGLEESMLKVGSAINELGMASTANEGYIVDFTKQVAGVAPMADISIQNTLGLAAALDKLGQRNETAATAIGQTITGMFKRTDAFAKVAKMDVLDFVELLNTDVNEALLRVLEGMNVDGSGLFAVVDALNSVKLDGQRAQQILGALADNVSAVRQQQQIANEAFAAGVSVTEEFNVKNNSATAIMEKRKKAIVEEAAALGQQLNPAINVSLSATTWLIKLIGQVIAFSIRHKSVILALTATYAAYVVGQKAALVVEKLRFFWSEKNRIALERLTIMMVKSSASAKLMAAAQNLLVGNLKAAARAFKMFWTTLAPWTRVVAILGVVGTALAVLNDKIRRLSDAQKALNAVNKRMTEITDEEGKSLAVKAERINMLLSELNDKNVSEERRMQILKDLQTLIPPEIALINSETIATNQAAEAARVYATRLTQLARLKAIQAERDVLIQQKVHEENTGEQLQGNMWQRTWDFVATHFAGFVSNKSPIELILQRMQNRRDDYLAGINAQISSLDQMEAMLLEEINAPDVLDWSLEKDKAFLAQKEALEEQHRAGAFKSEKEYQKRLLQLEIDAIQARLDKNIEAGDKRQNLELQLQRKQAALNKLDGGTGFNGIDKAWSLENDEAYLKEKLALTEKYRKGEIVSEEQYQDQLLALEIRMLEEHLAKKKETGADLIKLQQDLEDRRLKQKQRNQERERRLTQTLAELETDPLKIEEDRYQAQRKSYAGNTAMLEAIEKIHQRKVAVIKLEEAEADFKRAEEKYLLERKQLQNHHRQQLLDFQGTAEQRRQLKKRQNEELLELDATYLRSATDQLQNFLKTGQLGDITLDISQLSEQEVTALRNRIEDLIAKLQGTQNTETGDGGGYALTSGEGTLFGITQSDWDQFFENIKNGTFGMDELALAVQAVGDVFNSVMSRYQKWDDLQSNVEQKQLKTFQKNNDKKKKEYEARLNAGLMTEAQYNSELEILDAEYDAFQEELALKQAKRQKQMNIAQAIMNTALSVTMALAQLGPIYGPIAAAVMGALGAAEIAIISSTPLVSGAEEGGYTDVQRAQDGKYFKARLNPNKRGFVERPTVLVGEAGGEYVIPADGLKNPSLMPLIQTIEGARRKGTLRNLNFAAVYPITTSAVAKATGGFVHNGADIENPGNSGQHQAIATDGRRTEELFAKLLERLDEPIPAYITMLGKNGLVEMMKKYDRQREKGRL